MDEKEAIERAANRRARAAVAAEQTAKSAATPAMVDITLVLRRDFKLGKRDRIAGDVIAQLKLDADVSLAFLGDSITHGFVGPK
jgi:hypothetical protein